MSYLVQTYGIDRMKEAVSAIPYNASKETIRTQFEAIYGIALAEAELGWLAWLDRD